MSQKIGFKKGKQITKKENLDTISISFRQYPVQDAIEVIELD